MVGQSGLWSWLRLKFYGFKFFVKFKLTRPKMRGAKTLRRAKIATWGRKGVTKHCWYRYMRTALLIIEMQFGFFTEETPKVSLHEPLEKTLIDVPSK